MNDYATDLDGWVEEETYREEECDVCTFSGPAVTTQWRRAGGGMTIITFTCPGCDEYFEWEVNLD